MNAKVAIFVEGQTERLFVEKYVTELVGYHRLSLSIETLSGRTYTEIFATTQEESITVLIVDCGTDSRVLTAIRERYSSLEENGFHCLVGLRDLYPSPRVEQGDIEAAITAELPAGTAAAHVVLATMEIESWFVQEDQHYFVIDSQLTLGAVNQRLGIDIQVDSAEGLRHPSADLNRVYALAGKRYTKKKDSTARTVQALDIANLYMMKRPLLPSFDRFAAILDPHLA